MTTKKILFSGFIAIVITAASFGYYEFNKSAPDVADLNAKSVSAKNLYNEFTSDEPHANQLYLNKPVEVTGEVLEVKQDKNQPAQVVLNTGDPMFGIACTLDKAGKKIKTGDHVTIKGICTGYLNDVVLTRALIVY